MWTLLLKGRLPKVSADNQICLSIGGFDKGLYSQSYGFPVVMHGGESWTIKKAEHWRIDGFKLWCWRRLLRVPWTPRRSNQSILKEINSEYSLEGLIWKLKVQYFGHLMQRAESLEKTLMLGKTGAEEEGGARKRNFWMTSSTQWTWVWVNSGSWWWTRRPGMLWFMGSQRVEHDWATTDLNWTPGRDNNMLKAFCY